MAALSQNIARSRIPPATQASYFRYFTLRMCGTLELVCGALEPRCGALKPGALEPWGAQTATFLSYRSNIDFKHGTSVAFLLWDFYTILVAHRCYRA